MLPDFTSTKKKLEKSIFPTVTGKVHDSSLLSQMPKKVRLEGKKHSFVNSTGEYVEREYKKIDSKFSVENKEVLEKGILLLVERCIQATDELNEKITKGALEEMEIAATKAGNNIDAKGKLLTDAYLDAVEKIQVDFDDEGHPYLPSFVMHPLDVLRQEKRLDDYMYKNPKHEYEFNEKLDKIIEEKRKEWHDRESNRKLVD